MGERIITIEKTKKFEKVLKKIKDKKLKEEIYKQIKKIIEHPERAKLLKYNQKGERKIYIRNFRLLYSYKNKVLYLLDFDRREKIYTKLKR